MLEWVSAGGSGAFLGREGPGAGTVLAGRAQAVLAVGELGSSSGRRCPIPQGSGPGHVPEQEPRSPAELWGQSRTVKRPWALAPPQACQRRAGDTVPRQRGRGLPHVMGSPGEGSDSLVGLDARRTGTTRASRAFVGGAPVSTARLGAGEEDPASPSGWWLPRDRDRVSVMLQSPRAGSPSPPSHGGFLRGLWAPHQTPAFALRSLLHSGLAAPFSIAAGGRGGRRSRGRSMRWEMASLGRGGGAGVPALTWRNGGEAGSPGSPQPAGPGLRCHHLGLNPTPLSLAV